MIDGVSFENAMYSWLIFWIIYWISGSILTWKSHRDNTRKVTKLSVVINCLIINMAWTLLGSIILFYIPIRITTDMNIITKFVLCNIITEIWFYHLHIMAHHPALYKSLHKTHHEFSHSCYALTAMYCTGYEAVIINLFSVGLGPIVLNMQTPYLYIWFGLVALNSTVTHSGYTIGWIIDGSHQIHHNSFNYNYGVLTLLDRIYGTYKDPTPMDDNDKESTDNPSDDNIVINTE
jgi:sterol desaturase/sphingolipid hydroxylase (fatty acid hydroxylase superfamily)